VALRGFRLRTAFFNLPADPLILPDSAYRPWVPFRAAFSSLLLLAVLFVSRPNHLHLPFAYAALQFHQRPLRPLSRKAAALTSRYSLPSPSSFQPALPPIILFISFTSVPLVFFPRLPRVPPMGDPFLLLFRTSPPFCELVCDVPLLLSRFFLPAGGDQIFYGAFLDRPLSHSFYNNVKAKPSVSLRPDLRILFPGLGLHLLLICTCGCL